MFLSSLPARRTGLSTAPLSARRRMNLIAGVAEPPGCARPFLSRTNLSAGDSKCPLRSWSRHCQKLYEKVIRAILVGSPSFLFGYEGPGRRCNGSAGQICLARAVSAVGRVGAAHSGVLDYRTVSMKRRLLFGLRCVLRVERRRVVKHSEKPVFPRAVRAPVRAYSLSRKKIVWPRYHRRGRDVATLPLTGAVASLVHSPTYTETCPSRAAD